MKFIIAASTAYHFTSIIITGCHTKGCCQSVMRENEWSIEIGLLGIE